MKRLNVLGITVACAALMSLCACTTGQPGQTTAGGAQTTAATTQNGLQDMEIISYEVYVDEKNDLPLYYVDILGELTEEENGIRQDNGKGVTLETVVGTCKEGETGKELLEQNIDRQKNIVEEFGEKMYYLFESDDDGITTCQFGVILREPQTITFTMQFPTAERDEHFQHVSMLIQIYMETYTRIHTPAQS